MIWVSTRVGAALPVMRRAAAILLGFIMPVDSTKLPRTTQLRSCWLGELPLMTTVFCTPCGASKSIGGWGRGQRLPGLNLLVAQRRQGSGASNNAGATGVARRLANGCCHVGTLLNAPGQQAEECKAPPCH